jgi:hypothetical protein
MGGKAIGRKITFNGLTYKFLRFGFPVTVKRMGMIVYPGHKGFLKLMVKDTGFFHTP